MNPAKILAGILILSLTTSCGPSLSDMENIEKQLTKRAATDIPSVKEFHKLYPAAPVKFYFDRRDKGAATIQATDVIYDRYELTLTIDIKIDPKIPAITSYDAPLIKLLEITSIEGDANGPLNMKHGANFKISQEQWRKLVEVEGQFLVAGINVKTNEPVAGIRELKTYLQRPPIQ